MIPRDTVSAHSSGSTLFSQSSYSNFIYFENSTICVFCLDLFCSQTWISKYLTDSAFWYLPCQRWYVLREFIIRQTICKFPSPVQARNWRAVPGSFASLRLHSPLPSPVDFIVNRFTPLLSYLVSYCVFLPQTITISPQLSNDLLTSQPDLQVVCAPCRCESGKRKATETLTLTIHTHQLV